MASLFRKLQVWDAYFHGLKQFLLLYRCEKSELQTSLLGLKTLMIIFSNWLLPKQSKCSYKCFIIVFTEKLE